MIIPLLSFMEIITVFLKTITQLWLNSLGKTLLHRLILCNYNASLSSFTCLVKKEKSFLKCLVKIDIKPTLLHLLGIKTNQSVEFGTDLFIKEKDPLMVMRDGSFVSEDYVYTKNMCYKRNTGEEADISLCQPNIEKAKTELKLSDKLIYGDLLRFDPNNRYKTGTMTTNFE